MDNLKAKGLLDRSFIIPCLVGRPKYNIKEVSDKRHQYLRKDLEKTRKLLFACRMLHHNKDTIKDVNLNIFNREEELTKPLIQIFQNSPDALKELLPSLNKCLDAKRKVKSTSLEAILYTVIRNLIPVHGFTITNKSIEDEIKSITDGVDIAGQQAFYCQDLRKVTYRRISDALVDKFKATPTTIGTGNERKRGKCFTKEDLDRKGIEYDVPDEIKIKPHDPNIFHGPDNFDSILVEDGASGTVGTHGTVSEGNDGGTNDTSGTVGTVGTLGTLGTDLEGVDRGIKGENDGQIREEERGNGGPIKSCMTIILEV